ncbi:hypothetical protein DHEL01_v211355 [Diaporthe helianthi]|uniref:Xylanolytic transcriptional activator regulatory domain-containing protein n=1 Tax=Diaporthe helianthi TaxID=158607 RepID=A0A2P5HJ21_DIAHE|nr:hypothetical protein DHEL01_v211355 [Diaporthe helianthi]
MQKAQRKRSCNREYPCNHCTRRRRPHECSYQLLRGNDTLDTLGIARVTGPQSEMPTNREEVRLFASIFGYFEGSESNTLALVARFESQEDEDKALQSPVVPEGSVPELQKILKQMPERPILDFLIHHFVSNVNWMAQLSLGNIRTACDNLADELATVCIRVDRRGSLMRVQHILCNGLALECTGRVAAFWESLGVAVRVAQQVGLHKEPSSCGLTQHMDEIEKEMCRRTLCNLYIWDSLLARRLDRLPFLPDSLGGVVMPKMRLVSHANDTEALDYFTERTLQVRLACFWRSVHVTQEESYDELITERRYARFCGEFLALLPPAFALESVQQGHGDLLMLPLQRTLLHLTIFDFLCALFKPILVRNPGYLQSMAKHRQILILSQLRALGVAAFKCLECCFQLHTMMGGSHTRYAGIIFPMFEAAVVLVSLSADPDFLADEGDYESPVLMSAHDLLGPGMGAISCKSCIQKAQTALTSLQMLADVSTMADSGARTLSRLLSKAVTTEDETTPPIQIPVDLVDNRNCLGMPEASELVPDWFSFPMTDVQNTSLCHNLDFAFDDLLCNVAAPASFL